MASTTTNGSGGDGRASSWPRGDRDGADLGGMAMNADGAPHEANGGEDRPAVQHPR